MGHFMMESVANSHKLDLTGFVFEDVLVSVGYTADVFHCAEVEFGDEDLVVFWVRIWIIEKFIIKFQPFHCPFKVPLRNQIFGLSFPTV